MLMTGAELFVHALKAEDVKILFAYPGGQSIDLFDALYEEKKLLSFFRVMNKDWHMLPTAMPVQLVK